MNKAKEEYNKCAKGYTKATIRPMRKFAYEPTILNAISEIKGKVVLDIACGEGVSSRMIKSLGAKKVIGVDVSEELIKKAKETGGEDIEYFVCDIFSEDLSKFGKFDIITGIMILHYSNSLNQLKNLIKNISSALNKKGIIYSLTINPDVLAFGYNKYGIKISSPKKEGDSVLTELHSFEGDKYCEFTNYYWKKETYTKLLENEGFKVEWIHGIVSEEGIKEYGKTFWQDYIKNPIYIMIKATKVSPLKIFF